MDMHNAVFAKHYCDGLRWSLSGDYKGDKPFLDSQLIANLKRDAAKGYFNGQQIKDCEDAGFYFGTIYRCLLSLM